MANFRQISWVGDEAVQVHLPGAVADDGPVGWTGGAGGQRRDEPRRWRPGAPPREVADITDIFSWSPLESYLSTKAERSNAAAMSPV